MQIIKEKPRNLVSIAYVRAIRQEIEQKDRYTTVKIHNLLNEFNKIHFETRNPEIEHSISFNTSTLSGKTYRVEESGLNLLQTAEANSLNFNLELTENCLQVMAVWATESCSCPLVPEDWN